MHGADHRPLHHNASSTFSCIALVNAGHVVVMLVVPMCTRLRWKPRCREHPVVESAVVIGLPRGDRVPAGPGQPVPLHRVPPKIGEHARRRGPLAHRREGLTYYLDPIGVSGLIERITELSAPGSDLLIDFLSRSLLDSPTRREWLARLAERGSPWCFGADRPEDLLEPAWSTSVSTLSNVGKSLGRWPDSDIPREVSEAPQVFLVHGHLNSIDG